MDTMLSKALREFTTGPLNQLIVNLGGQDSNQWEEELKKFLRKEPCWGNGNVTQVAQSKTTPSILELVGAVVVPATTGQFVAKDEFVVNTKRNAPVKISAVWDNFTSWFLSGDGKIEDPISEQTLRYHKLRKASVDGPIINELGGEAKAETTLSEMFFLMKKQNNEKQKNGESRVLLNNGCANIFYIRDVAGVLCAVSVHWCDGGWVIFADSVDDKNKWGDGRRVFSRNSVL